MKKTLLGLSLIFLVLLVALLYDRLVVEKTFGPAALFSIFLVGAVFASFFATYLLYETRHRETTAKLWLATGSVITTYFLADLLAGYFLIQPLSPPLVPDEYRHHKLVPNSFSRLQQRDFTYVQRVNNFGLRGADVSEQKPENTYRILMLGDSFTMGKGVQDNETFSVLLQAALNQRVASCGGPRIEILNGAVDSYSPILSYLQLKRDLAPLQPDMVILNLDVSDLAQETVYRKQAVYDDHGEIIAVPMRRQQNPTLTDRLRTWTERHLFFTRALLFYVNELAGYRDLNVETVVTQANFEAVAHTLAQDSQPREEQWRAIFDSLQKIKVFSEQRGIDFLLSVYPWAHQIGDDEWVPGRYTFMPREAVASDASITTIRQLAQQHGIELLTAFPAFQSYKGNEPLYFRYDMHWTPAGHRVMASGLEAQLTSRRLKSFCKQRARIR